MRYILCIFLLLQYIWLIIFLKLVYIVKHISINRFHAKHFLEVFLCVNSIFDVHIHVLSLYVLLTTVLNPVISQKLMVAGFLSAL